MDTAISNRCPIAISQFFRVLAAAVAVVLLSAATQVRELLVLVTLALLGCFYMVVLHAPGKIAENHFRLRVKRAAARTV